MLPILALLHPCIGPKSEPTRSSPSPIPIGLRDVSPCALLPNPQRREGPQFVQEYWRQRTPCRLLSLGSSLRIRGHRSLQRRPPPAPAVRSHPPVATGHEVPPRCSLRLWGQAEDCSSRVPTDHTSTRASSWQLRAALSANTTNRRRDRLRAIRS